MPSQGQEGANKQVKLPRLEGGDTSINIVPSATMPRGPTRSTTRSAAAAAAVPARDAPASDEEDEHNCSSGEDAGAAAAAAADETVQSLTRLLSTLSKPEDLLTTVLMPGGDGTHDDGGGGGGGGDEITSLLRSASATLFGRLEQLAAMEERLLRKKHRPQRGGGEEKEGRGSAGEGDDDEAAVEAPLSGLTELYTGEETGGGGAADGAGNLAVDAETLWGQVDLQNEALLPKLRKSVKVLVKSIDREGPGSVKLLDFGDLTDNDDDDDDDDSGNSDTESHGESSNEDEEEDEDDDARRIRERMEKAMADMMSDDDVSDGESDDEEESDGPAASNMAKKMSNNGDEEEDVEDPAAQELNDGFFDINEMEAFADEEEDYLPEDMDAAVEEERKKQKKVKKAKLPHQRQRQGQESDDSEDEDDDDDDREEPSYAKRKKYREDDEIDALYNMYQEAHSDAESGDEDDEGGDVANMTASDFFGQPNKRYLRAKKGQDIGEAKSPTTAKSSRASEDKKMKVAQEEDVDSWDEHSFGDDENDDGDGPGWREERPEGTHHARGKKSDDDDDGSEESSSDEEEEGGSDDEKMEIEEEGKEPKRQTSHAVSSNNLLKQTEELEKEALAEKPWQMTGESKGTQRPTNSLLEATPEFEVATKMAPIITVEHTENIEEMIKKRIIDEDWDDVVPRELPDIGFGKRKGELPEVSQEKSKLGLGELYEREYLKKVAGYDKDAVERETEEDKVKNEMKALFANLCSQLDALSNYHFAPRPVADEAEIRSVTTPAIAMEEALPLHVSDARGVAPEEVYAAKKGRGSVIRGESEMDQTERKRLRNAKKAARRKARKSKLADEKLISRLQPGLGLNNPYEKRKLREELQMARASGKVTEGEIDTNKDYTTSTKFFQRMQENVAMEVHGGASEGRKRKRDDQAARKSSVYKL
jgi:U3 small nucleolar RNA-associated protein MPP10